MTTSTATCQHHWLLDSPSGPTIKGQCKKCRMKRTWPASDDRIPMWNDKTGKRGVAKGRKQ